LDLELTTTKCKRLVLSRGYQYGATTTCRINGDEVEDVDHMSIVGLYLSSKFKLSQDAFYDECNARLSANVRILYNLTRLNIIKTAKEWHTLIIWYISNTMFSNQYPLLAIDKAARTACDQRMVNSLRLAFNWSKNTPAKLVMLFANCDSSEIVVRK